MQTFYFAVEVKAENAEQAERVMRERIEHDEDYGFGYAVAWETFDEDDQ